MVADPARDIYIQTGIIIILSLQPMFLPKPSDIFPLKVMLRRFRCVQIFLKHCVSPV